MHLFLSEFPWNSESFGEEMRWTNGDKGPIGILDNVMTSQYVLEYGSRIGSRNIDVICFLREVVIDIKYKE
jgi:hypothetical protein